MDAFLDFCYSDRTEGHLDFNPLDHKENQPDQNEVDDRGGDKGEECFVGTAADNVAHAGQIGDGDIADDGGLFDKADQFAFKLREGNAERLRQNHMEKCLIGTVAQRSCAFFLSLSNCRNTGGQNFENGITQSYS